MGGFPLEVEGQFAAHYIVIQNDSNEKNDIVTTRVQRSLQEKKNLLYHKTLYVMAWAVSEKIS